MTMTIKAAAYRDAVTAFRRAWAELEAEDQLHNQRHGNRAGFGPPPAITELRHARACPDLSGSLQDDVRKVLGHQ
jgi:hypothetical protein